MNSGIYKIYFKETPNKVYIGSSKNIDKRKKQHLFWLRKGKHINPLLQYAFNKYGEEKLVFEIIENVDSAHLIEREKLYYCQAIDDGLMVYNILIPDKSPTNTGKTRFKKGFCPWNKGKKNCYSEITKQRMAQARIAISPWNKGKKGGTSWNKGKKMSGEHCQKLSESHKNQTPWFKKLGISPPKNTGRTWFKKGQPSPRKGKRGGTSWNKGKRGVMPIPWNKGKGMSDDFKEKCRLREARKKELNYLTHSI